VTPRFRRTEPDPVAARRASILIASLYVLGAALVVYFRLFPLRRVLARAAEEGIRIPAWAGPAATLGTLLVAVFLAWRGGIRLRGRGRRGIRPSGANPPSHSV
jgi:hypothetical protein